jgi:serine/threonine protein phosphatase PrpC
MLSSAGGRSYNEDHCNFLLLPQAGCWVLCDGLGGHGGGANASQLAVDTILQCFQSSPEVSAKALESYLSAANQVIVSHQASDPSLARMASTAVVLVSDFHQALWAHIGDSRLYHFREGRVIGQTKDHSVAQALADSGDISPAQIRFHPDRSSLRRSLGKAEQAQPVVLPAPAAVQAGDAFLLASDGFWEYVTETEMEVELSKAMTPGDWLRTMERRLRAKASADFDNYSAVAVLAW